MPWLATSLIYRVGLILKKILILDEHPIIRLSMRMLLSQEGFEVVSDANSSDVLGAITRFRPQILILELDNDWMKSIGVIHAIKTKPSSPAVVVFTKISSNRLIRLCWDIGADGYVPKTADIAELLSALRDVQSGKKHFPVWEAGCEDRDGQEVIEHLSSRELQVLQYLGQGKKSKEIAETLSLSVKTISTYKTRLHRKLVASSLMELILIAKRAGLA